ncbi:AAA family ATPase [Nonomuraea sp. NPDC050786]|uniref:helix-turn-helix transcriptional regulator n=1 Tax=Nonomuraea sp. NPDC050786 TaxID=3154840 RepID=UPI0034013D0E
MTLVGRTDALRVVEEVLEAAAGCVVVEGPAGIGKSRLLEEAAGRARARGTAVAWGRATELDRVAPLSTLLRPLTAPLGHAGGGESPVQGDLPQVQPVGGGQPVGDGDEPRELPGGGPPVGDGDRLRVLPGGGGRPMGDGLLMIERIGEAIERFTRSRALAIVLDDVQWADELTCLALRQLVSGLAGSPVVWLLGRRPLPEQEAVERLIAEGALRVALPPLTPEEAAELCGRLLGADPGPSVLELARAGGGNPFLLEEVLTGLRDEGRIVVARGVAAVSGAELPVGFVTAVERRLRDLSSGARRLLETASVLRRPFSVHEAAGVLGVAPGAVLGQVSEAVRAGALVGEGDRLAFRHDLIREAVYGGLGAAVRTALHREAAAVLRSEGRPPAELAEHLRHGARVGDEAAVRELRAAAREMTATAPSAAADLMLRALELARDGEAAGPGAAVATDGGDTGTTAADPASSAADTGTAAPSAASTTAHAGTAGPEGAVVSGGRDTDATAAGTAAPAADAGAAGHGGDVDGGLVAGLVAGVVRLLASAGRLGEAREVADTGGGRHPAGQRPAGEEAEIVLGLAEALKHAGDDQGVLRRTGRVLDRPGVPVRERARLLAVRAHALMMTGGIDAADAAAVEAVAEGEVFAQVVGLQARSTVALFRGDLGGALRHAERSVELADAAGGETAHRHPRLWLGAAMVALDRFEEAAGVYAAVEREAGRLGTAWALPLLHRFRAELLLAWGRLDDAAAEAEAGLRVAEQLSAMALVPALLGVLGHVALLRDEVDAARGHLHRGRELAGDGPGLVAEELRWRLGLLDTATAERARTGAADRAATGAARAATAHGGEALAYLIVQEPWTAARWRDDPRVVACVRELARRNPGVVSLAAGAAHAEGRLDEAIELYGNAPRPLGLAAALEEAGRREEALEVYRACGAVRGTGRLRDGRRPDRGWEALSPSELRVVRLVAQGMTNREAAAALFLSPHTVDSHLRHAFAKLGVNSRVELTRQVLAHEPDR